ncbi:hypothetical protein, partial [Cryptosporangium japonicum]|uniref:hypothetical protein n=1 Tax=Cryptosporangium japonicum TaxID=80872 RepID=UPI0031D18DEC
CTSPRSTNGCADQQFKQALGAPDLIVWLDDLPQGVRLSANPSDDVLLRMSPPRPMPIPVRPARLDGWIDPATDRTGSGPPQLVEAGPTSEPTESQTPPPAAVQREFAHWSAKLSEWSRAQKLFEQQRTLYEQLERAAKMLEQQDDEVEFVLAAGLLRWQAPDGERICRHLVVDSVQPRLDRGTAEVTVTVASGRRRLEDGEILRDQEAFNPDRGRPARVAVLDAEASLLDSALLPPLQEYLSLSLGAAIATMGKAQAEPSLPDAPQLSASPALMPGAAFCLRRPTRRSQRHSDSPRRRFRSRWQNSWSTPNAISGRGVRTRWGSGSGSGAGHAPLGERAFVLTEDGRVERLAFGRGTRAGRCPSGR